MISKALNILSTAVFLRRIFLFIFLTPAFTSSIIFSQNYPFREYSVLDGLPQSQTSLVSQDSRGFIWIATKNGLSRFDGIEFKNFFRKNGLPSNKVDQLIEDTTGNLWAVCNDGLSRYNGYGFEFFPPPPEFKGIKFSSGLTIDNNNNIFLIPKYPEDQFRGLIAFKDGVYSEYSKRFKALDTLKISDVVFDRRANELLFVSDHGNLWLWENNILTLVSERKIMSASEDRGNTLVWSNDSFFIYNNHKLEFTKLNLVIGRSEISFGAPSKESEKDFYDGRFITRIPIPFNYTGNSIDKEGTVWFSTEKNLYHLLSTAFAIFSEDDIGTRNIWALAEDRNGHIWFGSLFGTLVEYDGKSFRERNDYKGLFSKNAGFYKGSRRMSNGDLWLSLNMGVLIWNGKSFSRLKGIPDNTQICFIYEDPDDKTVMIGTEKGLFVLRNGSVKCFPEFTDLYLGVIEGVTKDSKGFYWLSGHNGLVRFDGTNSIPEGKNLTSSYTYTIEKDRLGGIWVTSEEGLFFLQKNTDSFIPGIPAPLNYSANSILKYDSKTIIVGRNSDICVIDLDKFYNNEQDYFDLYDKSDGFIGGDCLDNGIVKALDGKVWILTSNGVEIFDPRKVKRNPVPPNLNITAFDFQTEALTWEPVDRSQLFYIKRGNVRLNRHQNTVRIKYIGISTSNPEKVKYRHRLIGYEDKWSLPTGDRSVEYVKLSPGNYIFQVIASNANGVETPEPLTINLRVVPAFWQTSIFLLIGGLILVSLIILVTVSITKRSQIKKGEREKLNMELSRLQMSSVIKQFDPHFTFNVISSVGSLIMKGEKEIAYDYILKLSSLLRTVMKEGSVIIKTLEEEIDFVRRYCELQKLRFKERLSFEIDVSEKVNLQMEIPKMTIQTFVENSVKHGIESRKEGGQINVSVKEFESGIIIIVRDNGIGIEAAKKLKSGGSGYGLKIINKIFDSMNENNSSRATIEITDLNSVNNMSGTSVRIFIPGGFLFETGKSAPITKP